MARFCNKCDRKIKFFEEEFEGMCKECYNEYIYEQEQERKLKEKMRIEEERKKLEIQRKKEEERRYKEEQRLKIKKQEEERKQREVALSKAFINKNNNILSLYTTFVVNMQNENIILNNELKDILWNFLCRNYNQFVFQSDLDYQLYKDILIEMKIDINIEEYINSNFNQFFKYLLSLRETKELYQKSYDSKRWDNKYVNKNVQLKILNRMIKCYKKYTENEDDGNSNEVYLITLLYFASIYISLQGDILQPTSSKEKILTFEIDYTKFSELGDNDKIKYLVEKEEKARIQQERGLYYINNKKDNNQIEYVIKNIVFTIKKYQNQIEDVKFIINNILNIFNELQVYQAEIQKELQEKQEKMKKIEAEKKALREEEEKKRIKEEKKKKLEEKRKIKENKQKQMDYCKKYISERCMSNPNIINLFENIINTNSKYIDKELENFSRFFNKGQRIFRNILNEYIIEILNNLDKETRSIKDIMKFCNSQNLFELIKQMDSTSFLKQKDIYSSNIYKDSKIFDSKKIIQTILNYCLNQPDDNEIIEIYKQRKKEIESKIKAEKRKNIYFGLYSYEAELATLPLYLIYFYAIVIICVLKLCDSIEEFNNNEELITMYNNLISVTTNSEYIKDKLYPIYKKFYVGNFKVKLSIEEFWIMMIIKNDNVENIEEYDNLKINKNNPKKSLVNILSRKIGEISKINENRTIIIIAKILEQQKEKLLDKDIYNIIVNMDDILNEITKEAKLNVAGAEKERILKGDLSKEIEFEKLSLDISNIKDGFAFETYIAKLYCKLGYTIEEVTKKSGDQGADVIAYKDNIKYVIQAKFYSNPVGNKAVQEVVASIGMYNANKGIVVTNSTFTLSAIELANANNIELVDGEKIEEFKKIIIDKM